MSAHLLSCPFCGEAVKIISNRDWHKLTGDHTPDCVFDEDYVTLVPASNDSLEWLVAAWNRRAPQPPAVKESEQPSQRHDSRTAYESLDLKGRRRMDETLARVDQMIQDAKRRKHPDRRQHVAPVEVERRVADARGSGVHQDRD